MTTRRARGPPSAATVTRLLCRKGGKHMSFKVGIKTREDRDWVFNALRFSRESDAKAYAANLSLRWTAVTEVIVEPSLDEPNAQYPVPSDRYRTSRGPPASREEDVDS